MAYCITKSGNKQNSEWYREFTCDTVADIATLPTNQEQGQPWTPDMVNTYCSTGSVAFVIDTSEVYMLNSEGEWKKI